MTTSNNKQSAAVISSLHTELESFKSQLAAEQRDLVIARRLIVNLTIERDQAIKSEHVMRDWVCHNGGLLNDWAREWNVYNHPPLVEFIRQKLDTALPPIEGLVVVKDEPIYQEFDPAWGKWEDIDKEQYEFKLDEGWPKLRIVYAK